MCVCVSEYVYICIHMYKYMNVDVCMCCKREDAGEKLKRRYIQSTLDIMSTKKTLNQNDHFQSDRQHQMDLIDTIH